MEHFLPLFATPVLWGTPTELRFCRQQSMMCRPGPSAEGKKRFIATEVKRRRIWNGGRPSFCGRSTGRRSPNARYEETPNKDFWPNFIVAGAHTRVRMLPFFEFSIDFGKECWTGLTIFPEILLDIVRTICAANTSVYPSPTKTTHRPTTAKSPFLPLTKKSHSRPT